MVVGGDGSILRAAEVTWGSGTPVLGVNLGHVGFLAEAEVDDVEDVIDAIVERKWTPEDRLALDVRAFRDGELVTHTFALNEASVEKAARERMIEVDRRDRQPAAVAVGLRRGGAGDADGLDGLQLQRRRTDRLAGSRGAAHRADQRARPVRPAAGRGPRLAARRRGDRPHRRRRRAVVRRATGGRPAAGRPDRGTPRGSAGPAGAAAPGAVHRPAGGQVRPAGPGLARLGRAPPSRRGRPSD